MSEEGDSKEHEEKQITPTIQNSHNADQHPKESNAKNGSDSSTRSTAVKAFWVSIASALVSLGSMTLSGLNFYFGTYKPAAAEIEIGPQVLLSSAPRIGGWFTLANTGALPTTITSATLTWDAPTTAFDAAMTSRALDEWYFTEKGERNVAAPTHYSLFSPIPLPGRSDTNTILWFTSNNADFKFSAGSHTFTIAIFNGTTKLAEKQFELTLSDSDLRALDPMAELPVGVRPNPRH